MEPASLNSPVPPVEPADVQALWRFVKMVNPSLGDPFKEGQNAETGAPAVSFDDKLLAEHCGAEANVNAVFLRAMLLSVVFRSGLLELWQKDAEISMVVFQAAATFPIPRLASFDPNDFMTQLSDESGPR